MKAPGHILYVFNLYRFNMTNLGIALYFYDDRLWSRQNMAYLNLLPNMTNAVHFGD